MVISVKILESTFFLWKSTTRKRMVGLIRCCLLETQTTAQTIFYRDSSLSIQPLSDGFYRQKCQIEQMFFEHIDESQNLPKTFFFDEIMHVTIFFGCKNFLTSFSMFFRFEWSHWWLKRGVYHKICDASAVFRSLIPSNPQKLQSSFLVPKKRQSVSFMSALIRFRSKFISDALQTKIISVSRLCKRKLYDSESSLCTKEGGKQLRCKSE